jgi:hypothetical protein
MDNVMRIDFQTRLVKSDGGIIKGTERGVAVLFNQTVITSNEVEELIRSDMYEYDDRIIVTTPARADNLRSKDSI